MKQSYLTESFFVRFAFVQFIGLLSLLLPLLFWVYLASFGVIIGLAILDRFSLVGADIFQVSVAAPRSPEIGSNVVVQYQLTLVADSAPMLSEIAVVAPVLKTLRFSAESKPFEASETESHLLSTFSGSAQSLGFERLETVQLMLRSRWGLWFRNLVVPIDPVRFRVIPTRRKISEQAFRELLSHQRLLFQGTRQSLRGREAEQFHSVRPYRFPDPIRHLDPKKSAKFQRPMTRIYDSFFNHHLIMALDVGRVMCGNLGSSFKIDYFLSAALAIAENAQLSRDRVSFFAFSQKVHFLVKQSRSIHDFEPIFEGRSQFRPREEDSYFELTLPTVDSLTGQRSIVLLFTDALKPSVQQSLSSVVSKLAKKHLVVIVSLLDGVYNLDNQLLENRSLTLEDYNRLLYSYWVAEKRVNFRSIVARHGVGVVMVSEKDWLSVVVRLYALMRESVNI